MAALFSPLHLSALQMLSGMQPVVLVYPQIRVEFVVGCKANYIIRNMNKLLTVDSGLSKSKIVYSLKEVTQ